MKRLALLLLVFALVLPGTAFAQEPAEPTPAAERRSSTPPTSGTCRRGGRS